MGLFSKSKTEEDVAEDWGVADEIADEEILDAAEEVVAEEPAAEEPAHKWAGNNAVTATEAAKAADRDNLRAKRK